MRINYMLGEYLDNFIIVYFNNIIIYFNSKKEYKEHIKWVLKRLYKENMPIIVKKCEFYIIKTDFVGFIIKLRQISIDLKKSIGHYRLVRPRKYYRSKIILSIL